MIPNSILISCLGYHSRSSGGFIWKQKGLRGILPFMTKAKPRPDIQFGKSSLDEMDARILTALDANARLSMSELEATGVIRGFTIDVDTRAIGYPIRAMVKIRPLPGKLHLVERLIEEQPGFVECDKITGDDPFLARLVVNSIEQMDDVLEALSEHAVTSTAVIKGTSVKRRLPRL